MTINVKLVGTYEVAQIELVDEPIDLRVEIWQEIENKSFRARILRWDNYRLTPTYFASQGETAFAADVKMLVVDDNFDSHDIVATSEDQALEDALAVIRKRLGSEEEPS